VAVLLVPVLGAGGGAAVGGLADARAAPRHVVYASAPPKAMRIAPILAPSKAGVRVGWTW
jgi:hypothetical protein